MFLHYNKVCTTFFYTFIQSLIVEKENHIFQSQTGLVYGILYRVYATFATGDNTNYAYAQNVWLTDAYGTRYSSVSLLIFPHFQSKTNSWILKTWIHENVCHANAFRLAQIAQPKAGSDYILSDLNLLKSPITVRFLLLIYFFIFLMSYIIPDPRQ